MYVSVLRIVVHARDPNHECIPLRLSVCSSVVACTVAILVKRQPSLGSAIICLGLDVTSSCLGNRFVLASDVTLLSLVSRLSISLGLDVISLVIGVDRYLGVDILVL